MQQIKLNLGCGQDFREDYVNYDNFSSSTFNQKNKKFLDLKLDNRVKFIELDIFPWPFSNQYADEIMMNQVLEHLHDTYKVMKEIKRILKVGGIFRGVVPYAFSYSGMNHPQHYKYFTEYSFNHLAADFGFKVKKIYCSTNGLRKYIPFKNILSVFLNNIYDDIYFELEKI